MADNQTPTLEDLQKQNEALAKKDQQNQKIIESLKNKLSEEKTASAKKSRVVKDAEGNKYALLSRKFIHRKKEITYEVLAENPELVSELVKMGSGFLKAL